MPRPFRRRLVATLSFTALISAAAVGLSAAPAFAVGPSCGIGLPTQGQNVRGTSVTLDAGPGSGTTRVDYFLQPYGGTNTNIGQGYPTIYGWLYSPNGGQTFGWDSTTHPDFPYTLYCQARNGSTIGPMSAGVAFIVDNTPPQVSIVAPSASTPQNGLTTGFGGTVGFNATASDNVALSPNQVTWLVDNTTVGTAPSTPYGYIFSWNSHTVADGYHTITAQVTDAAGNVATDSETVLVHNSDLGFSIPPWWIAADGTAPTTHPDGGNPDAYYMPPWGPSTAVSETGTAAAIGAKWIRRDCAWDKIEPNSPSVQNWADTDTTVRDAKAAGLNVLCIIGRSPSWANGGHSDPRYVPTGHIADFQAFAQAIATRYGPNASDPSLRNGVPAYEIWNEPNNPNFFYNPATNSADVHVYESVLQAGYNGVKAASPSLTVASGGAAPHGAPNATPGNCGTDGWCNQYDWYWNIYHDHANVYFDALGYHPYGISLTNNDPNDGMHQTANIRALMLLNGDKGKLIWSTEAAISSGYPPAPNCNYPGYCEVDPSVLNQYVDAYIDGWRGMHDADGTLYTGPFMWFLLFDGQPNTSTNDAWNQGLYFQDTSSVPPGNGTFVTPSAKGYGASDYHTRS